MAAAGRRRRRGVVRRQKLLQKEIGQVVAVEVRGRNCASRWIRKIASTSRGQDHVSSRDGPRISMSEVTTRDEGCSCNRQT